MKRYFIALAMAGCIATPLAAQAEPPAPAAEESVQELAAKLGKLMKQASEEMAALEKELARASLSAPKADVVAERIKQIRAAMEQGKLEELPEGLRNEIKENPDAVAKATGKTGEEISKIAESEATLRELLKQNPEVLKALAASEDTMQRVLEKQNSVEKRLAETLQKTEESAEAARKNVNDSIDVAHALKAACQCSGGSEVKNGGERTQDGKEKEQKQGGNKESKTGANSQYQPGEGAGPRDDKSEEFERAAEKDGFQGKKVDKKLEDGSGNLENGREPGKYNGFRKKFAEETGKKIEERKTEGK